MWLFGSWKVGQKNPPTLLSLRSCLLRDDAIPVPYSLTFPCHDVNGFAPLSAPTMMCPSSQSNGHILMNPPKPRAQIKLFSPEIDFSQVFVTVMEG